MFLASSAAAIFAPSRPGKDAIIAARMLRRGTEKARVAPANVPRDATTNDPNSGPHRRSAEPRTDVPSSNNGVASVRETPCKNVLADDPPGGRSVFHPDADDDDDDSREQRGIQLTLESTKVSAIAVTGAPSSLPAIVVLPRSCASDAANDRVATFPQSSHGDIIDDDDNDVVDGRGGGCCDCEVIAAFDLNKLSGCTSGDGGRRDDDGFDLIEKNDENDDAPSCTGGRCRCCVAEPP
mmetsp:Transcript_22105/g.53553  ORF Transcript_22105/g.53553 Transcript_22105/m.53553 type:complete len:238 (+) Transcript_22105:1133-1846(+)